MLQLFVPKMSVADVPVSATVATMLKDLDAVVGLAQSTATAMPVTHAAQQLYRLATKQGLGQSDVSCIVKALS